MTPMTAFVLAAAVLPLPKEAKYFDAYVKAPAVTETRDAALPAEGYRLTVDAKGARIVAADDRGAFYARRTLGQLTDANGVRCCEIADHPDFPVRMIQIDDGRHFFGKAFVLKTLEWMAEYKLNTLHWHLCEDQGWRIQVDKYPLLTTYGATRSKTAVRGRFTGVYDDRQYGPYFYTKDDIREVVRRAKELHIDIIPEVEMPGHTRSIVAAYPNLGCPNHPLDERSCWPDWGICDDVICAGNDDVLTFYRDVIDEVCELFPDAKCIHMGGDECTARNWTTCPKCQARMRAEGLKKPIELQGWLTDRIMEHLRTKGRKYMGYAACLETGSHLKPADCVLMSGCGEQGAIHAARGYKVVMGPTEYCYWDFNQGLSDDPYVYGTWWAGSNPLNQVFSFNPQAGVPKECRGNILGGVGFNWSEYTYSAAELEWKLWPRAIAFAQALWNPQSGYAYKEAFIPALLPQLERLRRAGINAAPAFNAHKCATTGGASAANQAVD